ncbi:MAG: hypothetical protein KDB33_06880 [Acidimicrobiales bacterium]|nr:hypothetical protein [Acidimicrobiales bacterium]
MPLIATSPPAAWPVDHPVALGADEPAASPLVAGVDAGDQALSVVVADGLGVLWHPVPLLVLWSLAGVTAVVVYLWGSPRPWPFLVLGAFLGPLVAPMLADRRALMRTRSRPVELSAGTAGPGPLDVVVGAGARTDARLLAQVATDLLGPLLGRVAIVRIVDCAISSGEWNETLDEAAIDTEVAATLVEGCDPAAVLVPGADLRDIAAIALAERYDLVITDEDLGRRASDIGLAVLVIPDGSGHDPTPGAAG